jgi:hypothetical protein
MRRSGPQPRSRWLVVLLLGGMFLPRTVSGKEPKSSEPRSTQRGVSTSEARSKELLKNHFPLEEDIGALPVVRIPKVPEPKAPPPAATRVERPRPEKRSEKGRVAGPAREAPQAREAPPVREAPPPVVARPATTEVADQPIESAALAATPKLPAKKEMPREFVEAPALRREESQQIDDLVTRALSGSETRANAPARGEPEPALPALGLAAIRATMQTVEPEVKRDCRLGRLGVVLVRVVVAPSGEVARVTTEGKLAKAPPAACVIDRVKRARFPRSSGGSFQYTLTVR